MLSHRLVFPPGADNCRSNPAVDAGPAALHAPLMSPSWSAIVDKYRWSFAADGDDSALRQAVQGVGDLAAYIDETPLGTALFGWTSMFDLCIQQTDHPPYSGPYLRVSPLPSGNVEFRYFDTEIKARQWHREVPAKRAIARLNRFLNQVRWVAITPPERDCPVSA